jgi:hypothetical protein
LYNLKTNIITKAQQHIPVFVAIHDIMVQLSNTINRLTDDEYCQPSYILSGSSVGQHVRHIIEFFHELHHGYHGDLVNYENRERVSIIETSREKARILIQLATAKCLKPDKDLIVETMINGSNDTFFMQSTYYRELGFLFDHTVHHMALIRIGTQQVSSVEMPDKFEFSCATLLHRKNRPPSYHH